MLRLNRSLLTLSIAAALCLGVSAGSTAADGASLSPLSRAASAPQLLALRAGIFDPRVGVAASTNFAGAKDGRYAIVQFEAGEDASAARLRLGRQGHTVVAFVPNNAYAVRLGAGGLASLATDNAVRWVGAYASEWKVDPLSRPVFEGATEFRNDLEVEGFAGESAARFAAALRKSMPEAEVLNLREDANHPRLRVRVPSLKYQEAVVALSRIDGVLWIAPFVE
ncbi:MAG: hypothetical protein ABIP49_04550, partial [Lysobacterales bacterium]